MAIERATRQRTEHPARDRLRLRSRHVAHLDVNEPLFASVNASAPVPTAV
jgi:hypothetical protein